MELKQIAAYLLNKKGTTEETPFGPEALVYKVMGKMFALVAWEADPLTLTLKCEPGQALLLRDIYPAVLPGYHMNKTHWNTITLDGTIPAAELWGMIDDSYELVVQSLTRAQRATLLS
ncbi:MAG: MmcQ/YjbR family DNA-binding protein [Anaerolineae bacterium]|uniref:MmcQ/YjbR family DNA-binding protein n=1 Tax=Promineifilum sp. TaxID=2664178 RepID=UPI002411A34A|nr:MmcQ/YjbR family DNA-binding protein [Promineifilum sp.]MCW5845889.1 MmcQ/YjbR family DNA-binding protein [Anaerolineae bacterium]